MAAGAVRCRSGHCKWRYVRRHGLLKVQELRLLLGQEARRHPAWQLSSARHLSSAREAIGEARRRHHLPHETLPKFGVDTLKKT